MPADRKAWEAILAWHERLHPYGYGVIASVLLCGNHANIAAYFTETKLEMKDAYAATLSLASILSGFLTTFYAIVATKDDGFIGKMRAGEQFQRYLLFIREAMLLGFCDAILTLPLFVWRPYEKSQAGFSGVVFCLWVGLSVAAILAFLRVFRSIFILLETPIRDQGAR